MLWELIWPTPTDSQFFVSRNFNDIASEISETGFIFPENLRVYSGLFFWVFFFSAESSYLSKIYCKYTKIFMNISPSREDFGKGRADISVFLLFLLNVFSLLWCDCKIEMTTDHDITHSRYHGKYERIFALLCPRSELIIFKVNNHLRCRTGQKHTIPAISQTFTPCPISAGGKSEEASEANDFLP